MEIDKNISLLDFIGIKQEIEDGLERRVDLVEYDTIKPIIKDAILREQLVFYETRCQLVPVKKIAQTPS